MVTAAFGMQDLPRAVETGASPDRALFAGLLVLSCFVFGMALTAVMIGLLVFLLADPFHRSLRVRFPGAGAFVVIALAGISGAAGRPAYDAAKDLWYVSNAVLPVVLGYVIAQRIPGLRQAMRIFLAASAAVAAIHVLQFLWNPSYLAESFVDIRSLVSPGYLLTVLGFIIVVGQARFRLNLVGSRAAWLTGALCFASVVLSFSRTYWLALATGTAVVMAAGNLRKYLRFAGMLAALALLVLAVSTADRRAGGDDGEVSFAGKVLNSLEELKVVELTSMADINQFWRGFESYRALQTYVSGSAIERLIGRGFGATVDLGFVMTLADQEFESIPVLHNGYFYLLVKTGIIGLAAYLFFLGQSFRSGYYAARQLNQVKRFAGILLAAATLIVAETTLVITGLFSKGALLQTALLLGVLLKHAEAPHEQPVPPGTGGEE